MQSCWWCKAAICVTYTPYGCNDIEQDLLTPKQIQLQLFVAGAGTVGMETNPDFYMLQSNLKIKAKHSSGTKSGQYKGVQIRKMVTCRVEKTVGGCNNKGSFQSKSISTKGKTPTSRNWKKVLFAQKKQYPEQGKSWTQMSQLELHLWMIASRVRRQNGEAHQETAGSPKRSRELPSPIFHILNIELMSIKVKTKQKTPHTLKQNKNHYLLLGKNWEFADLKRFPSQNKTAHN